MDINQIFTEAGMRETSSTWRDQHMEDARQYGQIGDIIRSRLQQQHIEGDGRFSARRRARKVSKQVRRMERASQKAAAAAEALYGAYVNEVVELPQRREVEAARKAEKRQQRAVTAGKFVAKSLQKTTDKLNGLPAQHIPQVSGVQPQAQYVDPLPFNFPHTGASTQQGIPSIGSFFDQEAM
ncbi:hypothetical protein ACFQ0G_53105 [Streptomyces chiangmaiensis]|uniref:hypothetical protein n=1 Tax=Streptomyces chiangmaiensis TaxID=766497 RepID=UPI0031ED9944